MSRWIFGYGSLVWRPAFPFVESHPAFVRGWVRRFWQGSTDHRGVPEAPGRVVTLVRQPQGLCWGRAFRIEPPEEGAILHRLDHREKGGYERYELDLHLRRASSNGDSAADAQTSPVKGLVYVATERNENYLGPAELDQIAEQVRHSEGPSGHNVEYVLELAAALRQMGAEDEHVFALAEMILDES